MRSLPRQYRSELASRARALRNALSCPRAHRASDNLALERAISAILAVVLGGIARSNLPTLTTAQRKLISDHLWDDARGCTPADRQRDVALTNGMLRAFVAESLFSGRSPQIALALEGFLL